MTRRMLGACWATVLLCLLFAAPAWGHEQTGDNSWYWQRPTPQGNTVQDITMRGGGKGTAVGGRGTILHTTDGGANWYADFSGTNYDLYAVKFLDERTGFATGAGGTVLATTDGGANWTRNNTITNTALRFYGIDFATTQTGMAVGGNVISPTQSPSVAYRTTNGGATWGNVTPHVDESYYDVLFTSSTQGWIVGDNSGVEGIGGFLRTSDAGSTWWTPGRYAGIGLRAIDFATETTAWAVGQPALSDSGQILRSTDAGIHWWDVTSAEATDALWDVAFTSPTEGWAAGNNGELMHTTDGDTWTREDPLSPTSIGYRGLTFPDAGNGWLVGTGGTMLATTDGGASWDPKAGSLDETMADISSVGTDSVWAVGGSAILHSDNQGADWSEQTTVPGVELYGVSMADTSNGWAVGTDGAIRNTVDGGSTWTTQTSDATEALYAVTSTSDLAAWAAGENGMIVHTSDGGANWVTQPMEMYGAFYDIFFIDESNGWATGYDTVLYRPVIVHTTDGGATWRWQDSGIPASMLTFGIDFANATDGNVVGEYGMIYRTTDGGAHWGLVSTGVTGEHLRGVALADDGTGWIVGDNGTMLYSADTGRTWEATISPTDADWKRVRSVNGPTVWAVGEQGNIVSSFDPAWATTPPHYVRDFAAAGGDGHVSLAWVNPRDRDFAVVRALRSETGFATSATDTVSQTIAYEGTGTAYDDTGLTNATTYYYTMYAGDDAGLWSTAVTATATTVDLPPDRVTSLGATPDESQVALAWTNPTNWDYAATRLLRSSVGYATTATPGGDQTQVYDGASTTCTDTGLINGTPYYYTAYARDAAGLWSAATTVSATPFDRLPGPVTGLAAVAGDEETYLSWTNPVDADYAATRVLRSTSAFATTSTPGGGQTQVYDGPSTTATDTGLTNGQLYYYTAYARDGAGGWSTGATTTARPTANTTFALSSSTALTSYGGTAILTGDLRNSYGSIPSRLNVTVWRSLNSGATWTKIGTARYDWTALAYKFGPVLTANSLFQMRFGGETANLACTSNNVSVSSRAYLGRPLMASSVRAGSYFSITGLLLPPHTGTTELKFYRYVGGVWQYHSTKNATNSAHTYYTKYSASYRLTGRGRYYVKARHSDSNHAETYSATTSFTVY